MENVHSAIAWYQKKIGSYDKQLWEQSVEKKLQKGLPNVRHAPRKTVRLKTEYIDVDLIRGSTFTKTKPQVPWIYITRKAFVRVLFFPFYYKWWVHQTSWSVFMVLLFLYTLQVFTSVVYFRNVDGSIIEDELALTEVVVPISLMFLLGLIHSQTVLAHFSLKPPRRNARLRKTKKRQRQGNGHQLDSGQREESQSRSRSRSRDRNRVSPPRTAPFLSTLWSVPRVEVSTADQASTQSSSSVTEQRSALQGRERVRSVRKNVRIVEQIQNFDGSTTRSSDIVQNLDDGVGFSIDDIPSAVSDGGAVLARVGEGAQVVEIPDNEEARRSPARCCVQEEVYGSSGCDNNHSTQESGCNNNSGEGRGWQTGSSASEPNSQVGQTCPKEMNVNQDVEKDSAAVSTENSEGQAVSLTLNGSRNDEDAGCAVPCVNKHHEQNDTLNLGPGQNGAVLAHTQHGDVLAGNTALGESGDLNKLCAAVNADQILVQDSFLSKDSVSNCGRDLSVDLLRNPKDTSDSDSLAGKFDFVHIDTNEALALGAVECQLPTSISDSGRSKLNRKARIALRGCSSAPAAASQDGSSTSDLESFPHLSVRGVRGDRGSVSEDTQDQKDEDNMSDAGHVSNSSNYNPSDSEAESDAEGDNLDDSLQLTTGAVMHGLAENADISSTQTSLGPVICNTSLQSLTSSPRKVAQQQTQQEGESSASEPGSPDARSSSLTGGLRRRRRPSTNQSSTDQQETSRARPLPPKLLGLRSQTKITQTSGISSSENEAGQLSPESTNKATISSEEWEDRMQSDMTTSSSYSTSNSESELSENEVMEEDEDFHDVLPSGVFSGISFLPPDSPRASYGSIPRITVNSKPAAANAANPANPHCVQPDKVSCVIWEGNECKKVDLTALDIGWAIIDKVDNLPESSDYIFIGLVLSLCLGCVPLAYRLYFAKDLPMLLSWPFLEWLWELFLDSSWRQHLLIVNGTIQRLMLSAIFFFLLTVTDRTFKQRLLYAKHFSYLTSSRRARKFDMPHFRLNKVRNIKIWLSLRSYLKRRGPQRSVDVIVSAAFYSSISLICLMCIQMLKDADTYLDYLCNWELIVWCIALGIYIMRFMTLGLKINKKYRNLSVLITEQINLYLQMEQKPHKKEELTLANNVLRLAEDLLKELESPFKISGFSANPLIYNITKVVVLSAFSAVMTELLGFKLKLYKIKLKA